MRRLRVRLRLQDREVLEREVWLLRVRLRLQRRTLLERALQQRTVEAKWPRGFGGSPLRNNDQTDQEERGRSGGDGDAFAPAASGRGALPSRAREALRGRRRAKAPRLDAFSARRSGLRSRGSRP